LINILLNVYKLLPEDHELFHNPEKEVVRGFF
jgi:hypothetical protein